MLWFLYKILFYKNNNYVFLYLNFLYLNFLIIDKSFFLFNNILLNRFKKKTLFLLIKKTFRQRYAWTSEKKKKFFKIKFRFQPKSGFLKFKKFKHINKIIKLKKFSGIFKKKINLRSTVLKKRSLMFRFFLKNKKKTKFRRYYFRRYKKPFYKVYNIDLHKRKKQIFFENRKILRLFLKNKSLKKQNKLTSYLVNFLSLNPKNLLNIFEFRLDVILIKCHYFTNLKDSVFFIKNGFIFVNNKALFNPEYILKYKDIIKFINKKQYYLYYRNSINNSLFLSKKINWAASKFIKKTRFRKFFPKVYKWIYSGLYFGFDIPYFLEVDFINLTIIFIKKPISLTFNNYISIKFLNFYLTRLYNWNYIN